MGATLCFDKFAQLGHYLIVRRPGTRIIQRRLNLSPEPLVVCRGFFDRGEF